MVWSVRRQPGLYTAWTWKHRLVQQNRNGAGEAFELLDTLVAKYERRETASGVLDYREGDGDGASLLGLVRVKRLCLLLHSTFKGKVKVPLMCCLKRRTRRGTPIFMRRHPHSLSYVRRCCIKSAPTSAWLPGLTCMHIGAFYQD